jgi:NAD(P)-dependent dehydrogenase (short-subunit alcohol dehydrogenase family)
MQDLAGKAAFITGGVTGIGLGIARALGAAGMKLILTHRRDMYVEEALQTLRADSVTDVHVLRLDVTDKAAVERVAADAQRIHGGVHVLCNCAGAIVFGPADTATQEDWDWLMGVNLYGTIHTTMALLPGMKAHGAGGHIVNVGSMSSFVPFADAALYTASKFAVRGFTECLRDNLAPYSIGVSLVSPGLCRTRLHESVHTRPRELTNSGGRADETFMRAVAGLYELGMDPREVGEHVLTGIRNNSLYVFTHPEFREEMRELSDLVLAAIPTGPADPRRQRHEQLRRAAAARKRIQSTAGRLT